MRRQPIRVALSVLALLVAPSIAAAQAVQETFEAAATSWQVATELAGTGAVQRSTVRAANGSASARLTTASSGARAAIRADFSDAAGAHMWQERPGTYRWQRARLYVPAATVSALGANQFVTIGRFWASGQAASSWALRVGQSGALSVVGTRDHDGAAFPFPVYATLPVDQWVELEIGLHSQAGPGVKRAFAVVLNGHFHGWYHQGRMQGEVYDRSAIGLMDVTAGAALEAFVDDWGVAGTTAFPTGTDLRSTAALQEQDYRTLNGAGWQIDWATWANDLRMHPAHGLYSDTSRLQSGRNLDRMPALESGWAEIEIGWPKGTPPTQPSGYFGPMVGFRKEINREQNLEVIPIGTGGGNVDLVLEAWNERELILARWPMPVASIGGTRIPEAGDVIRVRWEQTSSTTLGVRASYYDASAATWHTDVIATTLNPSSLHGVNFADGFHLASSITTDSPYYGIRRFKAGTLATYPSGGTSCSYAIAPTSASVGAAATTGTVTVTTAGGCGWTATSNAGWVSVTGGSSGSGPGAVTLAATANTGPSARTGTVTIAGQTFTVTQVGVGAPPPPLPALSVGDVTLVEGEGTSVAATFPVWLSAPSAAAVTVAYATADGTAVAGADYVAASGAITFPAGTTSRAVTITVLSDPGLEDVETFDLRLSAPFNATIADGRGVASIVPTGVANVQPPTQVAVVASGGGLATIRWRAPALGPAPTGYVLAGGAAPGETLATVPFDAGAREVTLALPPGRYYLRLHARLDQALSAPSPEVAVPLDVAAAPSAPAGLLGTAHGADVHLSWRPTFDGGTPTAMVLDVSGDATVSVPLAATATTFSFQGVPPGVYTFAVRAANALGSSPPSPPVSLAFPTTCTGAPVTPSVPTVHRVGRQLSVSWQPPASGAAPTGYVLIVSGAFHGALPTGTRSLSGAVGPGLYGFSVVATNPCGASPPSPVESVTVP